MRINKWISRIGSSKGPLAVLAGRLCSVWFWIKNRVSRLPLAGGPGPVVSLTTYSKRVRTVYLTIESIARGSLRPSAVFLWLDEAELIQNVPSTLKRLVARGLRIRFCKNYGPHKKYYPYVESENVFSRPLATADDDVFYPRNWLRDLHEAFFTHPDVINCNKARFIIMKGNTMTSYSRWYHYKTTEPSYRHFATGVSGVIYPPSFLKILKDAGDKFLNCCPKADDVWLHAQAVRSGYRIRQIGILPRNFLPIPGSQDIGLYHENVKTGGNDAQIAATYQKADLERLSMDAGSKQQRENPSLSFVLLQYKNLDETLTCIESLRDLLKRGAVKAVVVDNFSSSELVERTRMALKGVPGVHLLFRSENDGYARGNNAGYRFAREVLKADFIAVLNNDTTIPQKDFPERVLRIYRKTGFSVLGPDIRVQAGHRVLHQNPSLRTLTQDEIRRKLISVKASSASPGEPLRIPGSYRKRGPRRDVVVHGSALVFSPRFVKDFEEPFDPRTFLYEEERILYHRAKAMGHVSWYDPSLVIWHRTQVKDYKVSEGYRTWRAGILGASYQILLDVLQTQRTSPEKVLKELALSAAVMTQQANPIVFYTVNLGSYDRVRRPRVMDPHADYICFSSGERAPSPWKTIPVPVFDNWDPIRLSRLLKIFSHRLFPDKKVSIYVDANVEVAWQSAFLLELLGDGAALASRNPLRDCLYDKADDYIRSMADDEALIREQMAKYRSEGFPAHWGLTENRILVRRHQRPELEPLMESWWNEVSTYSRDQLSFPYVQWKSQIRIHSAPLPLTVHPHRQKSPLWRRFYHKLKKLVRARQN